MFADYLDPYYVYAMSEIYQYRLLISIGLFVFFSLAEALFPSRKRSIPRTSRWRVNLLLQILTSLVLGALFLGFPAAAPGIFAQWVEENGWGLFPLLELPFWASFTLGILALDLLIYWQHRLFHQVPFLWRLHRVHHQEKDLDASSAYRFHTLEILFSVFLRLLVIFLLGIPFWAAFLFEVLVGSLALFNHANLKLHPLLDRVLRVLIVTPDMHRVHHSELFQESNSNYGFNLSLWDRLFRSYSKDFSQPDQKLGLPGESVETTIHFGQMLINPFLSDKEKEADR